MVSSGLAAWITPRWVVVVRFAWGALVALGWGVWQTF